MLMPEEENKQYLTKSTLWLMTIGAGLVVANNYYNQPLLGMIARELGESEAATSKVAMFTQMGYAAGLLLIIPLGDMYRRKRIILIDFIFIIVSLLVFALSQSLTVMIIASFFIGLTSVVPQVFVPIAAQLSRPEDKGKNVGIVMSGLLVGILASRVFSGLVGEYLGWREVFYIAAGMMVVMAALIAWLLPDMRPTFSGTYGQLMRSIARYTKDLPALRLASLRGALGFGSFSIFWTTLTFRLEQAPFFQGSDVAGMLGLVGIAGALAASLGGYISGKVNKNVLIAISCSLMILSWVIFGVGGSSYIGLIIGIIFIDMGLQGMHVTNQTIVFSSHPEASNRLNTVYMVSYFVGGSVGTLVGGQAWQQYGWTGVITVGGIFVILCLAVHLLFCNRLKYK
jgi:predicted MFS family arabinose efflux permease